MTSWIIHVHLRIEHHMDLVLQVEDLLLDRVHHVATLDRADLRLELRLPLVLHVVDMLRHVVVEELRVDVKSFFETRQRRSSCRASG